ncbi:hypothetical protein [Streptomyces lydicus]|uniref:hypothetical protein n=1 Tax=Streptomyces lydicus TaxID=47763 RepID=UPI003678BFA0
MAEKETAIHAVAQHADHVHWVRERPDKPTWRERFRRWVYPELYRFDETSTPPSPWVDRPAGHYEREGWRIRAAYVGSDLAFQIEYVVCEPCEIGWVESPYSSEGYTRCGLASAALRSLRHDYPGVQWHTAGGHFREAKPFWNSVSVNVPGGYTQRERCHHVEPWRTQ